MTPVVLGLTVAYVAVAALLLNLNLATSRPAALKLLAIVLVTGLYAVAWHGTRGLLGWPTPEPLPEAFRVHWITLDEPAKGGDEPGGIFFWIRPLDEAGRPFGEPRAHRLPWSQGVAERAQLALVELEGGNEVNGYAASASNEAGEAEAQSGGHADADGPQLENPEDEESPFEFRTVPRPTLPPKPPPER